jgi:hypothetical protein
VGVGGTELSNRFRARVDTRGQTTIAATVYQVSGCGGTPATWIIQYSLNQSDWFDAGVPGVSCTGGGQKATTYATLAAGARAELVWFRLFYTDGTTGSPAVGTVFIHFR